MSVYIITDRATGLAKIGYSQSPRKRLTMLRTSSAADLRLEAVIPGDVGCERALHRQFADLHVRREWFRISDEMEALMRAFPFSSGNRKQISSTSPCGVIDALGGTSAVAKMIEAPISTVHSWRKIGIPSSRMAHLRLVAETHGKQLPTQDQAA